LNFGIWWALCPPDDSRFAKGKAAIAVGSLDKLPMVIDVFAKAVRAGELDEQLNQANKSSRPIPPRKTA